MPACGGQHQIVWTKGKIEKGFTSEKEARKDAHRRIRRKVARAVNQDGLCDGDCDDEDECLPSWGVVQRDALIRDCTRTAIDYYLSLSLNLR